MQLSLMLFSVSIKLVNNYPSFLQLIQSYHSNLRFAIAPVCFSIFLLTVLDLQSHLYIISPSFPPVINEVAVV